MRGIQKAELKLREAIDLKATAQAVRDLLKPLVLHEKDKPKVLELLGEVNWIERVAIAKAYESNYGVHIVKDLERHFHQKDEHAVLAALFEDRYTYWAEAIHNQIKGIEHKEKLIELVLMMNNDETKKVCAAYKLKFNAEMMEAIDKKIGSMDWCRLLRAWMASDSVKPVEPHSAAQDLAAKNNEDAFISILCNTTHEDYKKVDASYAEQFGSKKHKTLRDFIIHEFSMKSEFAFVLCHDFMIDPARAAASLVNKAVKGAGTDDESLIYITVLFSDYFKGEEIINAYRTVTNGKDITKDLKGDLTGKYETTILTLWGLHK